MQINIQKKHFWVLAALVILSIGVFVYATFPQSNSPDSFGHSRDEVYISHKLECYTAYFDDKHNNLVGTIDPQEFLTVTGLGANPSDCPQGKVCRNFLGNLPDDWEKETLPDGQEIYGLKCKFPYETTGCGFFDKNDYNYESFIWDNVCGTFKKDDTHLEDYSVTTPAPPGYTGNLKN